MGTTGADGNERRRDGDSQGEKEEGGEKKEPPKIHTAQDDYKGPIVLTPWEPKKEKEKGDDRDYEGDDGGDDGASYAADFPPGDLLSALEQRLDFGQQVAILLIDMGSEKPFDEQYGSDSVGKEQLALIEAAKKLEARCPGQIHFIEIWIETVNKEGKRIGGSETLEIFRDSLPAERIRSPKPLFNAFEKTNLEKTLADLGIESAVVMGFDGNVCVKNTIFGTTANEYFEGGKRVVQSPGLLTLGIEVLTSRTLLGTDGAKLESPYRLAQAPPNADDSAPPNTTSLKRTGSQSNGSRPGHHEKRKSKGSSGSGGTRH